MPLVLILGAIATLALMVVALRVRVLVRRSRRRRRRLTRPNARIRQHVNRRRNPHLTVQHQVHEDYAERFHAVTRD
jgi:hypothetical protein